MSDQLTRPLRHALKQAAVTGTAGSLLLGAAVVGVAAPGATAATATSARTTAATTSTATTSTATTSTVTRAPVTIHTQQLVSSKRKVDVRKEMRTAAAQKGKPYRYGAAGPRAFDCSGYTSYVLKQQGINLNRTAAAQYRQTRRVSAMQAKVGDLVFFHTSGGVTHVGILAGKMKMWAAPHTGAVVELQKVYGHNWTIGRIA